MTASHHSNIKQEHFNLFLVYLSNQKSKDTVAIVITQLVRDQISSWKVHLDTENRNPKLTLYLLLIKKKFNKTIILTICNKFTFFSQIDLFLLRQSMFVASLTVRQPGNHMGLLNFRLSWIRRNPSSSEIQKKCTVFFSILKVQLKNFKLKKRKWNVFWVLDLFWNTIKKNSKQNEY